MESSNEKLPFLDILVIVKGNAILTDIYHKPTDSKRYVPFNSCHPSHTKRNIPYNLARRVATIISDKSLRDRRLREMGTDLSNCGAG